MNSDRIKEIQEATAYPESTSVMLALKQVWNECEQEQIESNAALQLVNNCDPRAHEAYKKYDGDKYCKYCGKKL